MILYSYVVARDYGFAPNPFLGISTLATCKRLIRKHAQIGDWVVGTGSKRYGLDGRLVYWMKVGEILSFDEYWSNPRFIQKRPNLRGSLKQAFGDNIYHRDPKTGRWHQENSHHSRADGRPNRANVRHDTQAPRVLIGFKYAYWGISGPKIPRRFRRSVDVCCQRGHKCRFPGPFVTQFIEWIKSLDQTGYQGDPAEFSR